jgi:hypothetical protein
MVRTLIGKCCKLRSMLSEFSTSGFQKLVNCLHFTRRVQVNCSYDAKFVVTKKLKLQQFLRSALKDHYEQFVFDLTPKSGTDSDSRPNPNGGISSLGCVTAVMKVVTALVLDSVGV